MKILVDAMGGDNAPLEIVRGAVRAVSELNTEVTLVGQSEAILRCLQELNLDTLPKGLAIAGCTEVVTMEDDPAKAVREKKDSSMAVMLRMLRDGEGDAAVSAGSTGALLSGATLVVHRVRGIRRAALAPILPTKNGGCILIDCGANSECTPEYLHQFALMGHVLAKAALHCEQPRIGLLNIGAEESKGTALQKETYALLQAERDAGRLNFIGNVEARDALSGVCEVLVADGFSGNVMLKTMEGTARYMTDGLKKVFTRSAFTKLAALIVRGGLKEFKKSMDYNEVGGTVFLGISKPVIKAHGSSSGNAIFAAIRQAAELVGGGIAEELAGLLAAQSAEETV